MDSPFPQLNKASSPSRLSQASTQYQHDHQQSVAPIGSQAVSAACVACRTKHLKCDGLNPCSRCATHGLDCGYLKSRRGYKGPRKSTKQSCGTSWQSCGSTGTFTGISPPQAGSKLQSRTTNTSPRQLDSPDLPANWETSLALTASGNQNGPLDPGGFTSSHCSITTDLQGRCLEAFFYYFSPAHPFLPPKSYLLEILRRRPLSRLEAAIRYVGSCYVKTAPTEHIAQETTLLLSSKDCIRDGFTVQAMLLFTIGLDGNCEIERAAEVLTQAEDLALEIGMHHRDYAITHGEGVAVMEESWRRTWWELFIVDGMIAGVHQQNSFRLNGVDSDVLLPCEEQEYISGLIPVPRSIEEFDDQPFADNCLTFSSFAYRIAAVRNLGRVLQLQQIIFHGDPLIDRTDAYLINWGLHLPDSKKPTIDSDGQVDEMLFQAQMITNASSILLHRPYSQLDTSVARTITSCAPFQAVSPGQVYNIHAAKIIQAADNISKLITLPISLIRHTHFFTCVITLASMVHLSYWAALLPLSQDENLKQQLRLSTGALKSISDVWPSASRVGNQVKVVAQEVFASRKLAAVEGFWGDFTNDDIARSIIEDEVIISTFS